MRDKERKKHTQCLEAAKPPRRGLWREVLPCALPAILHLSLCGQIRCSISSRSLGTTATCNRQHETIPRQCPKARGWGDAAANPRFLGCRGDGEAGGGGAQGTFATLCLSGRKAASAPSPSLPLCLRVCCILPILGQHPSQGHGSPKNTRCKSLSLAVPLAAGSHLKRSANKSLLLLGFHSGEAFFIINPRKRLQRITLIK